MRTPDRERGFSLAELLVALLFTGLLMAGMATVFRSSLSTLSTSSETLSSGRRNRMSLETLYDDLNQAGMLPTSLLNWPPAVTSANPPFQIVPNQPYTATDVANPRSDQLVFYLDELLPFTGTMATDLPGVMPGQPLPTQATIQFRETDFATQLEPGMVLLTRAGIGYPRPITSVATSGKQATVSFGALENIADPTQGGSGGKYTILANSEVLLARPARYVRYSIQGRATDPEAPTRQVPCLIRETVAYGRPFAPGEPGYTLTVIAENVTRMKVYLSVDGGQNWAGLTGTPATWADLVTQLNSQLANSGRPGYQTVLSGSFWFREIPTAVRLDITTRTLRQRTEYAANPSAGTPAYREQTQSLVLIPRHFGLPYGRPLTNA